tara:strand:+ start:149 stop:1264 length:1116 start_codon:yes stop_codon:yes gene_type:complete
MKRLSIFILGVVATFMLAPTVQVEARDQISIVGSSTVYPYGTVNAQRLGEEGYNTPTYNSTGTGGGMKLFCGGVGVDHPDMTGASRPMKAKEAKLCAENGVNNVIEVMWANDGITFSHSNDAEPFSVTREEIFMAMAKEVCVPVSGVKYSGGEKVECEVEENPYTSWNQINPNFPDYKIEVLVAPPTSGTRDAFDGNVMEAGCNLPSEMEDLCVEYREDGRIIEMGENDTLIVQKLREDKERFGYFGYSYLKDNADRLQAATVEGVAPTAETIAEYEYPMARPLFIYVKADHVGVIPGIQEYTQMMVSDAAIGDNGYLTAIGAAPMVPELKDRVRNITDTLDPMGFNIADCVNKEHPLKDAGYKFSSSLCK